MCLFTSRNYYLSIIFLLTQTFIAGGSVVINRCSNGVASHQIDDYFICLPGQPTPGSPRYKMVPGPSSELLYLHCNASEHVLLVHNVGYMCSDVSGVWSEQTADEEASKFVITECNIKRECSSKIFRPLEHCEMRVQYVCINKDIIFDFCKLGSANLQIHTTFYITSPNYPSSYDQMNEVVCPNAFSYNGTFNVTLIHSWLRHSSLLCLDALIFIEATSLLSVKVAKCCSIMFNTSDHWHKECKAIKDLTLHDAYIRVSWSTGHQNSSNDIGFLIEIQDLSHAPSDGQHTTRSGVKDSDLTTYSVTSLHSLSTVSKPAVVIKNSQTGLIAGVAAGLGAVVIIVVIIITICCIIRRRKQKHASPVGVRDNLDRQTSELENPYELSDDMGIDNYGTNNAFSEHDIPGMSHAINTGPVTGNALSVPNTPEDHNIVGTDEQHSYGEEGTKNVKYGPETGDVYAVPNKAPQDDKDDTMIENEIYQSADR